MDDLDPYIYMKALNAVAKDCHSLLISLRINGVDYLLDREFLHYTRVYSAGTPANETPTRWASIDAGTTNPSAKDFLFALKPNFDLEAFLLSLELQE